MKHFMAMVFPVIIFTSFLSAQWTKLSFPTTEYLWKVRFAGEQIGWIAGHNYIYKTTNGGNSWSKQDSSIGSCDAMFALNDQVAIFSNWTGVGENTRGIRRTSNGGATWTTANAEKNYYTDIDFGSAAVGYTSSGGTAGNKPLVKKTTDAGATWTTVSQNFPKAKYELTGISFVDENTGWTVSYDGFVYKTINGGIDWSAPDSLGFESFRDIEFFNKDTGWAVGGIGGEMVIVRTTNGGTLWTKTKLPGGSLREAEALTSKIVWCAAMSGQIIATADAGETWFKLTSDINGFESLDMVNIYIGYAVGSSGKLYKTTNGGIVSAGDRILSAVPRSYSLEQNFPNPFNPSTTIQFSLPGKSIVSLKIFSVTGELIEDLLHRSLDAGTYSVNWNAGTHPSGVYYYTLSAGNFFGTKKLTLIK
jgi:photosystem II stability/assembly factor-like uncharacterized protein